MLTWPDRGEDLEATLHNVVRWAHSRFEYVPDLDRWKENFSFNGDHWETDAELLADMQNNGRVRGDCDAFAKMCWMALRSLAVPSRLVLCLDETGGGHLVCEASGWILDNRYAVVIPRDELERLGYEWLSKSGYAPGQQWTTM